MNYLITTNANKKAGLYTYACTSPAHCLLA